MYSVLCGGETWVSPPALNLLGVGYSLCTTVGVAIMIFITHIPLYIAIMIFIIRIPPYYIAIMIFTVVSTVCLLCCRIPQLLTGLMKSERVLNVLLYISKAHPQAVYFPIRTLYLTLKMEQKEKSES